MTGGMTGSAPTRVDDEVLLARAYLSRVGEPADVALWAFVHDVGPVEAMHSLRRGRADAGLLSSTAGRRTSADPEADLVAAERHGVRLIVPESDDWPSFAFAALERAVLGRVEALRSGPYKRNESGEPTPPLALWARGTLDTHDLGVRAAGIVGARAATSYGEHVTAELGYGLAGRGVVVVSGGAYGIDAAAHRSALAAQGRTVLVSAAGLDRAYPQGNASLYDRVAETGLVLSESPPGCAPQRQRFLTRNRLIAALSTGVVVVEASARSGATNTAGHARALGRPLMAVPGPVTSAMSAGCHALLRHETQPALLVTGVDDVLAVVGTIGEGFVERELDPADLRTELDRLDPVTRRVFEGLPAHRFARPDEIAARSSVTPLDVIRVLPLLDEAGLIEARSQGYRVAPRVRG